MGNCGSSINCTAVNQPVEANPDVAGIGVVVSFVATAVITFIAIVVGYLSDSLPDTSLSQLDRACIFKFSTIRWRPWIKDSLISLPLRRSMTAAIGFLGWSPAVAECDKGLEDDEKSRDARERHSKALLKFILALSDQQLVTGLAVLIAGFISPCSMSIYHFNIIAALGWFSATTHLSTLAVLRVYFIQHPRLRNWRVVAMLFVFVLLIITQVSTTASVLDNSVPVRCAFTHASSEGLFIISILSIFVIIIFLSAAYSDRIVPLYKPVPEWSLRGWFVDAVVMVLRIEPGFRTRRQQYIREELLEIVIESSKKPMAEQSVLWQNLNERRRYKRHYAVLRDKDYGHFNRVMILMEEINHSFLGDLLTSLFSIVYGITLVFVSRSSKPSAGIVGSQNIVNFGQLVPLLLMLLPLFAAAEVYFERRENISTKPSDNGINSPGLTHGKSFFSRRVGIMDLFKVLCNTQPTSNNESHTVVGSTSVELQDLPAGRLRRPDTETGQRALMTVHSESTRTSSRNSVPENVTNPAKAPKKSPSPWRGFTLAVACYTSFQALFAISLGGVPSLSIFSAVIIVGSALATVVSIVFSITIRLGQPWYPYCRD